MEGMFSHLGWSEILVLAVVGLVIFGPDRLPKVARDAVAVLRQLRAMARGAASDLRAELGPEMADLDLASLHPRRLVGSLLEEDPEHVPAPLPVAELSAAALAPGETPPYDVEAT
jgi:sec-independent protein translocase protein TatB